MDQVATEQRHPVTLIRIPGRSVNGGSRVATSGGWSAVGAAPSDNPYSQTCPYDRRVLCSRTLARSSLSAGAVTKVGRAVSVYPFCHHASTYPRLDRRARGGRGSPGRRPPQVHADDPDPRTVAGEDPPRPSAPVSSTHITVVKLIAEDIPAIQDPPNTSDTIHNLPAYVMLVRLFTEPPCGRRCLVG